MASPPRNPAAGGIFVALGAVAGTALGLANSQPTIGFLSGLTIGVAAAVAVWWVDRRG